MEKTLGGQRKSKQESEVDVTSQPAWPFRQLRRFSVCSIPRRAVRALLAVLEILLSETQDTAKGKHFRTFVRAH
jgi:hypothetical protein